MDAFESAGEWWLPESPNVQMVGLLSYSNEKGFNLEIPYGHLGELSSWFPNSGLLKTVPIIIGRLRNGKIVTLFDVSMTDFNLRLPGSGREAYYSSLGFVGEIEYVENSQISQVQINYAHLRDWVGNPAGILHPLADDEQDRGSVNYHFRQPKNIELASENKWKIILECQASWTIPSVEGFHLESDYLLHLILKDNLTFDQIESDFLNPLFLFFSFCLNQRTYIRKLRICLSEKDVWFDVGMAQGKSAISKNIKRSSLPLLSMLKVPESTNQIIGRWLEFKGDERRAISLLVSINNEHGIIYSDLIFLYAAQALAGLFQVKEREKNGE